MKAKRWISLLLAVSMMLGVLAMPASAAAQQPESTAVVSEELPDAAALSAAEDENDIVNIRIRATGNLVYGSDYKLEVETRPENTQYIAVVLGTSGEAYGYVTLMISDKLRTLLKLIPLPKKMSQTPDQAEEFNVYSYLKQLIDGNDVSVLLRVADEVVSVMDTVSFFVPASYLTTVKNVSNGMKLALSLIRKYLPEGAFSRIYLDEQPVDAGNYVAGALALESSDMNTAGFAMFRIKPKRDGVRMYWAQQAEQAMTAEELEAFFRIYLETCERDGIGHRPLDYFQRMLEAYGPERCRVCLAEYEGEPLAAAIALHYGCKVFYIYGASSNEKRNLMPAYAMQAEMIRWACSLGVDFYDFGGVYSLSKENGLYRFKEGFCHSVGVTELAGEFDQVLSPFWYWAFLHGKPLLQKLRARRKK